jgi:NADH:ubiquinone oxidoreductase subunit 5 (subunit L)/multisubunit Na+/H+ antiporter MnhA subunit
VYQQTHTRNMEKLGGLIKLMPRTAILFLIGAIAIGGMPPFNGFISEFLIYSGLIEGIKLPDMTQIILMVLSFAGLSVIGGLSVLTFTKTFGVIFLGTQRQPLAHKPHEVSVVMLIPQYIIVVMMLSVAIFPGAYLQVIGNVLTGLTTGIVMPVPVEFAGYISIMQHISLYSVLLIGVTGAFWGIRAFMLRGRTQIVGPTWGCGYTAPTDRIQYTGKSFSKSLGKMFNFIVIERKQYEELKAGEIFPAPKKYTSHYHDFFEFRFIHVITNRLIYGANYFRFIQNGRVQSYVLYGILFIMAIFLLTIFNIIL